VTKGFRCEWGAETYAAFRSVVSTIEANCTSVLDTIRFVLSPQTAREALITLGEQLPYRNSAYFARNGLTVLCLSRLDRLRQTLQNENRRQHQSE
jgi:hypothetical protein